MPFNELTPKSKLAEIINSVREKKNLSVFGVPLPARKIISTLFSGKIAYVFADLIESRNAYEEIKEYESAVFLPPCDDALTFALRESVNDERVTALTSNARVIVTSVGALTGYYPISKRFFDAQFTLKKGDTVEPSDVVKKLVLGGYRREVQVTGAGRFALRGDILDIWVRGADNGVRVEFFGDVIETIKRFDLSAQLSSDEIDEVLIPPSTQIFLTDDERANILSELKTHANKIKDEQKSATSEIITRLETGGALPPSLIGICPHETFFEFFKPDVVIYDDARAVVNNVNAIYDERANRFKAISSEGFYLPRDVIVPREQVFNTIDAVSVAFHTLNSSNRIFNPDKVFTLSCLKVENYSRKIQEFIIDARTYIQNGFKVVVFCGSESSADSFKATLKDNRIFPLSKADYGGIYISEKPLFSGAVFHDEKTVFIGYADISRYNKKRLSTRMRDVFTLPQTGEYVVHEFHGIGYCEDIKRLDVAGSSRDYVVLSYLGGDKLYVPIENIDILSKLNSAEEHPKLSKLGGVDFARVKEKVRQSVKKMAFDLLELFALRENSSGHAYSADNSLLEEFEADFLHEETEDQLKAVRDGLNDLTSGKIMDRLLCGDVGYGKTEVALRLAFKVVCEGKQVLFVSPTTILATQHYKTLDSRMQKYGITVRALTRFNSATEIKSALEDAQNGKVDIICGTHRALSNDVVFKDLGLVIIDEEQRFGVADKEKIKKMKLTVNMLSMSATPIPRTLHMSLSGIRDISVLDTPPDARIPVQTYVLEYSEALIVDAVSREFNRKGQVFIVYNHVISIEDFTARIQKLIPFASISFAHGQMNENALEKTVNRFINGELDVLVSSTIIENGIDIPNANTMIVIDSDLLGLSQLYQLRGRVGRSNRSAYVYFTYNGDKILTDNAVKRLDAITEHTDFGAGFKIALRDLQIRGAGNVLGREQHGHIERIGYDLYAKLLANAISELKGEQVSTDVREVKVFIDFDAFVPHDYIEDESWRIRVYGRIASIKTQEEVNTLLAELTDVYGEPPSAVKNLTMVALIKNLAVTKGAVAVTVKRHEASIEFEHASDVGEVDATLRFSGEKVKLVFGEGISGREKLIEYLTIHAKN